MVYVLHASHVVLKYTLLDGHGGKVGEGEPYKELQPILYRFYGVQH